MATKVLLSKKKVDIILSRLCHQLIETHGDFSNTVLVGLQPRGTILLDQLKKLKVEEDCSQCIPLEIPIVSKRKAKE